MKRDKQRAYRVFLNPRGTAMVNVRQEVPLPFHEGMDAWNGGLDQTISISDCGRQVTLEFDAYDEKDVRQRLAKLDKLRAAIDFLEDGLIDYYFTNGCLPAAERKQARELRKKYEGKSAVSRSINSLLNDD